MDSIKKTVIDCGNCGPDHSTFTSVVSKHFNAVVIRTHGLSDTLDALQKHDVHLITVNRKLDRDHSDGLDVIKQIKSDSAFADIPVMMVTNFEDHQKLAMDAGCVRGFGKLAVRDQSTIELLTSYLGE